MNNRLRIAIMICLLTFISSFFPSSVLAAAPVSEHGGTVTIVYGDSAQKADVTLTLSNTSPYGAWGENASSFHVSTHTSDIQIGNVDPSGTESVFFKKSDYSEEYEFLYWRYTGPNGVSGELYQNQKPNNNNGPIEIGLSSGGVTAKISTFSIGKPAIYNTQMAGAETYFVVSTFYGTEGDWTIEPIFAKVSPYTVSLSTEQDAVNKSEEVSIDLCVAGPAYDDLSATITYDPALFVYEAEKSLVGIDVTETTQGTLKLTATDLNRDADVNIGTLVFKAKAVSTDNAHGDFVITGAKIGTSPEAVSKNALDAKLGDASVGIDVNKADTVDLAFWITWDDVQGKPAKTFGATINVGQDYNIAMSEIVNFLDEPYDPDHWLYSFDTNGLRCEVKADNRFYIYAVDQDVDIMISRTQTVPGELSAYQFKINETIYTVAKFTGTPESGKTFFYDDYQMIKVSDGYLCIIGEGEVAAIKSRITEEDGEDIVMALAGDVNQTGIIDINDAQLVSDIYNGKWNLFAEGNTVEMVKFLAADVNGNNEVTTTDITAVVDMSGFVY